MRFTPCAIAFLVKRRVGAPSSALGVAAEVMPESLLEAVRRLRAADPDLGVRRLLASLREQQLDLEAGSKEIHLALNALKTESRQRAGPRPLPRSALSASAACLMTTSRAPPSATRSARTWWASSSAGCAIRSSHTRRRGLLQRQPLAVGAHPGAGAPAKD